MIASEAMPAPAIYASRRVAQPAPNDLADALPGGRDGSSLFSLEPVVSGGDGSLEPGGALGQWGGDAVTLGRDGRAGAGHIAGELRGGDPGAVGEVGSSGDRLGPAGGRDLQDEGATAAASDTVPSL